MFYLCFRSNIRSREDRVTAPREHFDWMKAQHAAGTVVVSGPSSDRRYGMYLIRASSRAEADRIAGSDPYTMAGDTTFAIVEWDVHQIFGVGDFEQAPKPTDAAPSPSIVP